MILIESSILMQVQRLPNSREATELATLLSAGEAAVTGAVNWTPRIGMSLQEASYAV